MPRAMGLSVAASTQDPAERMIHEKMFKIFEMLRMELLGFQGPCKRHRRRTWRTTT